MLGSNTFDGFGELGFGVLYDMTFVEYAVQPIHLFQARDIVTHDFVRSNDHVKRFQL